MSINLPAFHRPLAYIWLHIVPTLAERHARVAYRAQASDSRGLFVGGGACLTFKRLLGILVSIAFAKEAIPTTTNNL